MDIAPFAVEIWMNEWETKCEMNLAETCVQSLTIDELLTLSGQNANDLSSLLGMKMTYGDIRGSEHLLNAIAALYEKQTSDNVIVAHGTIGANMLVHKTLVSAGDRVVAIVPTYQQHYSIPTSIGADVQPLQLKWENRFLPDLDELRDLVTPGTRMIAMNNPNNPTGNVASPAEIDAVLEIVSNWPQCMVIADEIYVGLDFTGQQVSVASRSTSVPVITLNGVSKVYFAPGWRIGWFGLHDPESRLASVREALERLLRSRLCASTPAQRGYLAGLTGDRSWMGPYAERVKAQRQRCLDRIATIEGLDVEAPGGAFYMFVRLTEPAWANNDKQFVLDLLDEEHVLLVHGSGFSPERGRGHVRLVYLADVAVLDEAFDRIERFLKRHRV